jgi:hypothetical protein
VEILDHEVDVWEDTHKGDGLAQTADGQNNHLSLGEWLLGLLASSCRRRPPAEQGSSRISCHFGDL